MYLYIKIILLAICVPTCVVMAFLFKQREKNTAKHRPSDHNFTVGLPDEVLELGLTGVVMATALMLIFTFVTGDEPHLIFYIVFGSFFLVSAYLGIRTLISKVVVKGDQITVYSALKKPYTFTFSEIISAVRRVKPNQLKTEYIDIKTANGKKLTVGSVEEEYERFYRRIRAEVDTQYLVGFKKY